MVLTSTAHGVTMKSVNKMKMNHPTMVSQMQALIRRDVMAMRSERRGLPVSKA